MKPASLALPLFALLAACGGAPDGDAGNGSAAADGGAPVQTADAMKLKPGAWAATNEIVTIEMEGVDPAMLKGGIGQKTEFTNCVTPEQAARPASDFFTHPDQKTGACKSESFAMTGGKLQAVVVCQPGQGQTGPTRMEMTGTYAPDAYAMTVTMKGSQGGQPLTVVAKTTGRHVGDVCEAKKPG